MALNTAIEDEEWGCVHQNLAGHATQNIHVCRVSISDIKQLASELTHKVLDTSWMMRLDRGAHRAYEKTVDETAGLLKEIFEKVDSQSNVKADFGELMVSMSSARALDRLFNHLTIPLAELWKPKAKQNEGFDFHTICQEEVINFGEAKFASSGNPYHLAIKQVSSFLKNDKHRRDWVYLVHLVSQAAISKFEDDAFGVVVAFSLNAKNHDAIFKKACGAAEKFATDHCVHRIYLIGVSHGN